MLPMESPERPVAKAPGRIGQALIRLLMKRATVTASERLARDFRLITLEGPALEGVAWTPGQKIQIAMGSAFTARTYTPIEWNPGTGRACILGHVHGDGPGSAWVRDASPSRQQAVRAFRASLRRVSRGPSCVLLALRCSFAVVRACLLHLLGVQRARPLYRLCQCLVV